MVKMQALKARAVNNFDPKIGRIVVFDLLLTLALSSRRGSNMPENATLLLSNRA